MIPVLIVFGVIGMLIWIDISLTKTNREKDSDEVVENTIANIKSNLLYDVSRALHNLHSKTLREVREAITINGNLLLLHQDDISDISERYTKELDAAFSDIVKKMYSETMSGMQGDGKRSDFGTAMSFHGDSHYFLAFQKLTMRKMIRALKKLEDEVMGVTNELKESCLDKNPVFEGIVLSCHKRVLAEKDIEEGKTRMTFKFERRHMINVGKFLYELRDKLCR